MAYKDSYKIPNSLNRSFLDQEVVLFKSFAKPLPMKVIIFYLLSFVGLFWVVGSTFVKDADFSWISLFVVWWVLATVFLGQYSKTKELRVESLGALLEYVPRVSRRVFTRRGSFVGPFSGIVGVKTVEPDGAIVFLDGSVGQCYLVVGSASALVFEEDKRAIINRVDSFYRKVDAGVEYVWLTTKEPQRVFRQLANLERKNLGLVLREPELFYLLDEQASILADYVGNRFSSIHQYLLVRADSREGLRRAHALLMGELQESSLMIKNCSVLDDADLLGVLENIYAYR